MKPEPRYTPEQLRSIRIILRALRRISNQQKENNASS
jgi:hypothetical protein